MKTLFIVNPTAGRGGCDNLWRKLTKHISFPYDVVETSGPKDATLKAREAVDNGFDRIVAVGGDGTLHEVVNGIAHADVQLGVIPAGTGNDFVRTLGIPQDPKVALAYIEKGDWGYVDLGKFNGSYFINSAGAGLDAETVRAAKEDFRFVKGPLAYVTALVATLMRFSPWDANITVDGRVLERKVWLVAVANGKYIGGGMMMAPDATAEDGLLEVCIVNEISRGELLRFFPRIFKGSHVSHPAFEVLRGKDISIEAPKPITTYVDGEVVGGLPVAFSVIPKAIKVIRQV